MTVALAVNYSLMAKRKPPTLHPFEVALADNAKALMGRVGIDQAALAEAMTLSDAQVSEFINRKKRLSSQKICALADALGVSVHVLWSPTTSVALSVTPARAQSASIETTEDADDSTRLLNEPDDPQKTFDNIPLDDMQREYDEFAARVSGAVDYFGILVGKKTARAAARESSAREDDRRNARKLRHQKGKRGKS